MIVEGPGVVAGALRGGGAFRSRHGQGLNDRDRCAGIGLEGAQVAGTAGALIANRDVHRRSSPDGVVICAINGNGRAVRIEGHGVAVAIDPVIQRVAGARGRSRLGDHGFVALLEGLIDRRLSSNVQRIPIEGDRVVIRDPVGLEGLAIRSLAGIVAADPGRVALRIRIDPRGGQRGVIQMITHADGIRPVEDLSFSAAGEGLGRRGVVRPGAAVGIGIDGGVNRLRLVDRDQHSRQVGVRRDLVIISVVNRGVGRRGRTVEHRAHHVRLGSGPRIVHINLACAGCRILDAQLEFDHPGVVLRLHRGGVAVQDVGVKGDKEGIVGGSVAVGRPVEDVAAVVEGDVVGVGIAVVDSDAGDIIVGGIRDDAVIADQLEEVLVIHEDESGGTDVEVGLCLHAHGDDIAVLGRVGLDILAAELLIAVELEECGVVLRHPLRRQHIFIIVRAGEIIRDREGRVFVDREGQTLGRLPVIEAVAESLRIIVIRHVVRRKGFARVADEGRHRNGVILRGTHADVRVEDDLDLARIPLRIRNEARVGIHRLRPDDLLREGAVIQIPAAEGVAHLGGRSRRVDGLADVVVHVADLRAAVALENDLAVDVSVFRIDRLVGVAELEAHREGDRRGHVGLEVTGEDVAGHFRIVRGALEVNRRVRVGRDGTEVLVDAEASAALIKLDLDRRDIPLAVDRHGRRAGHCVIALRIDRKRLGQRAVRIPAGEGVMRLVAGVDGGGGGIGRIRVELIVAVERNRERVGRINGVVRVVVSGGENRDVLRIVVERELRISHDRAGLHGVGRDHVVAIHFLQAIRGDVVAVIHRVGRVIRHLIGRAGHIVVDRDRVLRHVIGQRPVGGRQRGDRVVDLGLGGVGLLLNLRRRLEGIDEGVELRHVGGVARVGVRVRERALRVTARHVVGRAIVGLCLTGRNAGQEGLQLRLVVDLEFHGLEPAAFQRAVRLEDDTEGPLVVTGRRRAGTAEEQVEGLADRVQAARGALRGVGPLRGAGRRSGVVFRLCLIVCVDIARIREEAVELTAAEVGAFTGDDRQTEVHIAQAGAADRRAEVGIDDRAHTVAGDVAHTPVRLGTGHQAGFLLPLDGGGLRIGRRDTEGCAVGGEGVLVAETFQRAAAGSVGEPVDVAARPVGAFVAAALIETAVVDVLAEDLGDPAHAVLRAEGRQMVVRPVDTGAEQDVLDVGKRVGLVGRAVHLVGNREGDVRARRDAVAGRPGDLPHRLINGLAAHCGGGGVAVSDAGHVVVRRDGRQRRRRGAVQLEPNVTVIRSFTVDGHRCKGGAGAGVSRNTGRRCLDHRVAEDVGVVT